MKKTITLLLITSVILLVNAQENNSVEEGIQNYKNLRQNNPPLKNGIMFLGDSNIEHWKDMDTYFPDKYLVKLGFNGATLLDFINNSDGLLTIYNPKQMVIYIGENDFSKDPKLTYNKAYKRFKQFYKDIRRYFPTVKISYISMKLAPEEKQNWSKMVQTNAKIKWFLNGKKNTEYIDVVDPMEKSGLSENQLYQPDQILMKPTGYSIWAKKITPSLL